MQSKRAFQLMKVSPTLHKKLKLWCVAHSETLHTAANLAVAAFLKAQGKRWE